MRKTVLSFVLLVLLAAGTRADVFLGTSTPPTITAGTTSAPVLINVFSNTSSDVMNAWMFTLTIQPEAGATGTLTFASPPLGDTLGATQPPNYIFDGNSSGIHTNNTGTALEADDFAANFPTGTPVSQSPSVNLLAIQLLASPDASGQFDIVATGNGPTGGLTLWLDGSGNPQPFANAADGTDFILASVTVVPMGGPTQIPEPSTLALFGLAGTALAVWRRHRRQSAA